ncbi:uncharacterized protein YndB with AHSA1/START domain [Thermocatellispora tengchongensis]|uniref:Uncharacterized protein YndB with AHSA1/START domain n=1 Tax=Thermocatellispora tengchongensis TaxID=1073253 RepID=A0A840PRF1_9ACTN|nr:SRPBCC family protein [Thermocatellispora tengchongensis]MBB5140370.1 uncharacterized protein YndB with AHSA1/START domain [Thermocatellispora tengchongensis]
MLGDLVATDDGRFAVRFERVLDHPPQKVWRALTEPGHLAAWFPVLVEFHAVAGAALRFELKPEAKRRFDIAEDEDTASYGEVIAADPPRLLEYTWGNEILRWELQPHGDTACRLVFTNVFDERDTGAPAAAGWHVALDLLTAALDGREVPWSPWDRADELTAQYAATPYR